MFTPIDGCPSILLCHISAVAKDCTGDRVLLSIHMEQQWKEVCFIPDSGLMNEVDEEPVVGVQVGPVEKLVKSGPDLTQRYNTAVMINGFNTDVAVAVALMVSQTVCRLMISFRMRKQAESPLMISPQLFA